MVTGKGFKGERLGGLQEKEVGWGGVDRERDR